MNIVLSNDDGVYAPGIRALKQALDQIANVTIVAPLEERSTTGHTLSLDVPLRLVEVEKDIYGLSGYPADCIMMATGHIMRGKPIDLVISGINRGANLAQDVYYSGTVAAAREAAFHGHKAIAVSLTVAMHGPALQSTRHYDVAAQFVRKVVESKIYQNIEPLSVLNINVPNLAKEEIKGVKMTTLGFRQYTQDIDERLDCRHRKYFWIGGLYQGPKDMAGSDCNAIEQGHISISSLKLLDGISDGSHNFKDIEKLSLI